MGKPFKSLLLIIMASLLLLLLPAAPGQAATSWEAEVTGGFGAGDANPLAMPIVEYGGDLFCGVSSEGSAQVWLKEAGASDWAIQMSGGFGDTDNIAVARMEVYDGYLYAGTANMEDGCGVYRYNGTSWESMLTGMGGAGFGNADNLAVTAMTVYEGALYVGVTNYAVSIPPSTDGAFIYRYDGASWSQVGTLASGTSTENCGIGSLEVYGEYLYACTIRFDYGIVGIPFINNPLEIDVKGKGCELWRTDGAPSHTWSKMATLTSASGDMDNLTALDMCVYDGKLLIGTTYGMVSLFVDTGAMDITDMSFSSNGLMIYQYDGTNPPTAIVSGGFGSTSDMGVVCMEQATVESTSVLLVGTAGPESTGKLKKFDGTTWSDMATDGFGNADNLAIASLAVTGGTTVNAGTLNREQGCEVWCWADRYSITVSQGSHGSIAPAGSSGIIKVLGGSDQSFTVTADTGYHVEDVVIDGTGHLGPVTSYTFEDVSDDHTITATFAINTYTLSTGQDGSGSGTVSKNPSLALYEYGDIVQLTAIADSGSFFVGWSGDLTGNTSTATLTMDSDKTVIAIFSDNPVITVTQGTHGTISPEGIAGVVTVDYGADQAFTITPYDGYHVAGVTVDGSPVGAVPSYTFENVTAVHTITASFAINTYTITAMAGAGGTISPAGAVSVEHGSNRTFTVTPYDGYHVAGVTVDGLPVGAVPSYTFENVTDDHTITAGFAIDSYTITAMAGAGGTISPAGAVSVEHGSNRTFTVTPDSGYVVADVVVDGTSVGALSFYTFTNVKAGHTITASFAESGTPSSVWYLAEGSTDWGFDCYISIENPNQEAVHVNLTYMTSHGVVGGPEVTMPAMSQATVFPRETLGAADFSTRVACREAKDISMDRTMYWTGPSSTVPEAHCATGVTSPAATWYMPEGCSDYGFECFLLIQNPNDASASCDITWMLEGEDPVMETVTVGATSRATYNMADSIGAKNASIKVDGDLPVICERAMYRNDRREGHDSCGTTTPAVDYYLAEGCSGFGFTTYILVQNPQSTPTNVAVTYQTATGPVTGPAFQMPANSRKTICVNETTIIPGEDPSFSTLVQGSQPIIAERAMYWNGGADSAQVCHDSIGLDQPHSNWYLSDGQTSEGRETWTLVQNPNDSDVIVEIVYMTPNGVGNVVKTETVAGSSRRSFNMAAHSGISGRAAIMVGCITPGKKIMVERAMYWNDRGTGTDTVGGYTD